MRSWSWLLILLLGLGLPLQAQDLEAACHATSTYDLTLQPRDLVFERATPDPVRVVVGEGGLRVDGVGVHLDADGRGRLTAFEHEVRALVPRVRTVAEHGVDLATQSVRAEVDRLGLSQVTRDELERRLAVHASSVKQRIVASQSTKDWHGSAFDQYASELSADLLPLVTADLGQQALQAAVSGDTQAALTLRDRALDVAGGVKARLHEQMQALRPSVAALCPSVQRLLALQQGMHDARGQPLLLLERDP